MIYYVEDDTNIRDLTVYALKQAGFEAAGFTCGRDFFEACDEKTPDLVLLDIMLPEMDGLEILRELRSLPLTKNIPVMMLTAKGTEFDKVCGLDAGADDYLAKPFGMMELVSRVNALLRRAQAPAVSADDTLVNGPIELVSSAHTVSADAQRGQGAFARQITRGRVGSDLRGRNAHGRRAYSNAEAEAQRGIFGC